MQIHTHSLIPLPPQTTNGEPSSPWQFVSPESLSPSFELVQSDPEHKTPENPLPPHGGQEFCGTVGVGSSSSTAHTERLPAEARAKVVEGTRRENRSKGSGISTSTLQHSGRSSNFVSGDGVIVTRGHEQGHTRITSSSEQTGVSFLQTAWLKQRGITPVCRTSSQRSDM